MNTAHIVTPCLIDALAIRQCLWQTPVKIVIFICRWNNQHLHQHDMWLVDLRNERYANLSTRRPKWNVTQPETNSVVRTLPFSVAASRDLDISGHVFWKPLTRPALFSTFNFVQSGRLIYHIIHLEANPTARWPIASTERKHSHVLLTFYSRSW